MKSFLRGQRNEGINLIFMKLFLELNREYTIENLK